MKFRDLPIHKKDSSELKTEKIQFWKDGIMLTATMSLKVAREKVEKRKAFIISNQAIGHVDSVTTKLRG